MMPLEAWTRTAHYFLAHVPLSKQVTWQSPSQGAEAYKPLLSKDLDIGSREKLGTIIQPTTITQGT